MTTVSSRQAGHRPTSQLSAPAIIDQFAQAGHKV
jgi:hypothetical protein